MDSRILFIFQRFFRLDMIVSPDFLLYFEQLAPLLQDDPTLWCISSWNDNGHINLVGKDNRYVLLNFYYSCNLLILFHVLFVMLQAHNGTRIFRTEFFPGLGWLLTRTLWNEVWTNMCAYFCICFFI